MSSRNPAISRSGSLVTLALESAVANERRITSAAFGVELWLDCDVDSGRDTESALSGVVDRLASVDTTLRRTAIATSGVLDVLLIEVVRSS